VRLAQADVANQLTGWPLTWRRDSGIEAEQGTFEEVGFLSGGDTAVNETDPRTI
jgi:hypothetical protein